MKPRYQILLALSAATLSACSLPMSGPSTTPTPASSPSVASMLGPEVRATAADFRQGAIKATCHATDLAILGPGLFVLSRVPEPKNFDSLVFSRNGTFHFEFVPDPRTYQAVGGGAPFDPRVMISGHYFLRDQNGLYVMGVRGKLSLQINPYDPKEADLINLGERTSAPSQCANPDEAFNQMLGNWGDYGEGLSAIRIPVCYDPQNKISLNRDFDAIVNFETNGLLRCGDMFPQDAAINPQDGDRASLVRFIVLATFTSADCLLRFGSTFRYDWKTGAVFMGLPATGEGRIGLYSSIRSGALETFSVPSQASGSASL